MSDDNDDNPTMDDKDSPHIASGNDNAEKGESDENTTEDVSSIYHHHIEHFFTFLAGNTVFSLLSESPR